MDFFVWHYSTGLNQYFRRWYYIVGWVVHFFSLTILPLSLFSPWRRLVDNEDQVGFNLTVIFRQLTFNLISRTIGAIVRICLLFVGLICLVPALLIGAIGLIFWLIFPPIGLPYFLLLDPHQKRFYNHLVILMQTNPDSAVKFALDTRPGRFLLTHLGLALEDLTANLNLSSLSLTGFSPVTFSEVISKFINSSIWDRNFLRAHGLDYPDLLLAAKWWDSLAGQDLEDLPLHYHRPGIGLELLFGYTPTLNKYSSDLSLVQSFSHHLIGREQLVSRIERILTGGNSVILYGLPGVGKKTVVLEYARRCMDGELGPKMSYKRVLELDYNFLLSESMDINQKKSHLSLLLKEAASAGNIILAIKDIHRLTNSAVEGLDFTDIFEKHLETSKLKLIAISSTVDYERFITTNTRLRKFLEPVEATTPTPVEAMEILLSFAATWESQKHLVFLVNSLQAIITGTDKYVSDTPFPEKALELLDHVINFAQRSNVTVITPDDVNNVLSEMTGISMARLSEKEKQVLSHLEEVLHQSLIGQNAAVDLIAKSLRARSVGAKSEDRPLGSFLFLGPTGVGKTQAAKSLAEVYFGSSNSLLRFDMAEYAGNEGLARLIGSINQNLPGRLTTDIKSHPASLLLLDEIEKAPPEVDNLFLSLLDEGSITDAQGRKINCKHLFVIATSNAGAEYIRQLVSQNTPADRMQKQVVDYIQKQGLFSPEFLNRFDGVVVFEPLDQDKLISIAALQLKDLVKNLDKNNITLEIAPEVSRAVVENSYEPEFGARPMRREVDIIIGDVLGKAILDGSVNPGDKIRLTTSPSQGYLIQKI